MKSPAQRQVHVVRQKPNSYQCETCHGPSAGHTKLFRELPTKEPAPKDIQLIVTTTMTTEQRNAMCAPCHAKMSPVTMNFAPGERYFDHFDLTRAASSTCRAPKTKFLSVFFEPGAVEGGIRANVRRD
jgi:hypothetical protein